MKRQQETVKACSIIVIWSKGSRGCICRIGCSKYHSALFPLQTTASLWSVKINTMANTFVQSIESIFMHTIHCVLKHKRNRTFCYCEKSYLFYVFRPSKCPNTSGCSLSPRLNELQKFIEYWAAGKVKHDI